MNRRVIGLPGGNPGDESVRLVVVSEMGVDERRFEQRSLIIGVQGQRPAEGLPGFVEPVQGHQGQSLAIMDIRIARIFPQDDAMMIHGPFPLPEIVHDDPLHDPDGGPGLVQREQQLKGLAGFFVIPHIVPADADEEVEVELSGLEFNRLLEVFAGPGVIALEKVTESQMVIGLAAIDRGEVVIDVGR